MSDKVLKSAGAASPSKVIKGDTYGAGVEAAAILDAAHAEAGHILANAEEQRQAILESARAEGYQDGLRNWNAAVSEANEARDRLLADSEPELIRLAVRIAQKILGEELHVNPEAIVSMARECLQGLGRERSLTLRVSSSDIGAVRRRIDGLREMAGHQRSIEVVADAAVATGGCIVESEYGVVDARLETQLHCMEEILLRAARR